MYRQDYRTIARVLRQLHDEGALCFDDEEDYARIITRFAQELVRGNAHFTEQQFREEAGVFHDRAFEDEDED